MIEKLLVILAQRATRASRRGGFDDSHGFDFLEGGAGGGGGGEVEVEDSF